MNLPQALALSRQLNHTDKSKLYGYFDAITFVESVEAFLGATHGYLATLTSSDEDQAFTRLIYQSIILPIVQSRAKPTDLSEATPSPKSCPTTFIPDHHTKDDTPHYLPLFYQHEFEVKPKQDIDFYDDFYQALYLNHWQDEAYLDECCLDEWLDSHQ